MCYKVAIIYPKWVYMGNSVAFSWASFPLQTKRPGMAMYPKGACRFVRFQGRLTFHFKHNGLIPFFQKWLKKVGSTGLKLKSRLNFRRLLSFLCTRRDSNPYHKNRNLAFYPLNYGCGARKGKKLTTTRQFTPGILPFPRIFDFFPE